MRLTDTYLLDLPDATNERKNIEAEQLETLQAKIGLTLWAALQVKEDEDVRAHVRVAAMGDKGF